MTTRNTQWMSARERSSTSMMRLMIWLSLLLGRRLSRVILSGIAAYFFVSNPKARKASGEYLRRVLGRKPRLSERYRHIFTFAGVIHDRVYLLKNKLEIFDIEVIGLPLLAQAIAEKKPIMVMGAHLGSFELLRAIGKRSGVDIAMLMYVGNARKINTVFKAINPDAARDIIQLKNLGSMLEAKTAVDEGRWLGMLADRGLGDHKVTPHDFLGSPASFPQNPFRLAALLGCRVIFMSGLYLGGNRYEAHFVQLGDFTQSEDVIGQGGKEGQQALMKEVENAYVEQLSRLCCYAPFNWFNFYDFWQSDAIFSDATP